MITTLYFKDGTFISTFKLNTSGQQAASIEAVEEEDPALTYYEVVFAQPAMTLNYPAYRIIRVEDDGRRGEFFAS